MTTPNLTEDVLAQFEASKELVAALEEAWADEGHPLLTEGGATGKALVPHPLVKMLAEARRDVARYARQLGPKASRGPAPAAVVRAKIGKAPSSKRRLKAVGE